MRNFWAQLSEIGVKTRGFRAETKRNLGENVGILLTGAKKLVPISQTDVI